ncbi:MAG: PD40 domain-containing protein, partial [Methanoculleus sp.]|nr:PD40 domain-containing protein [Methanoculleus sp.]
MKRFIRITAVAAVLVIAVLLVAGVASAQLFPPGPGPTQTIPGPGPTQTIPGPGPGPSGATAITSGPGDKGFPAISGNTIVWLDNSTMSVQVYDAASGRSMTVPGNNTYAVVSMRQVDVSGNYVVWTGVSAATMSSEIYLYDTARGSVTPLTNDQAYQMSPSISGDTICWNEIDMATGKGKVYVYGIAARQGGSLVSENASGESAPNQLFPAVGGDTLAWFDDGGNVSGHLDLTWLSLSTGDSVTFESSSNPVSPPAVSSDGRLIAWVAEKNGTPLLFMADTVALKVGRVTDTGAMPANPAVDG